MTLSEPYYEDECATIYHGDCREVDVAHNVIHTDPPYGVRYRQPRVNKPSGMSVVGDDEWRCGRPSVPFVVWGANLSPEDYSDCGWLVWDKKRYGEDLYGDGEMAATDQEKGVHIFPSRWHRNHGDGWTGSHPTEKPVQLVEWCLSFLPEGIVLDPYMGAGSTLIAAKRRGRKAIGIEIEERYCEIAAERLSQGVLDLQGTA